MGHLNTGLHSIAKGRAKLLRTTEKIMSESVEAEADESITNAMAVVHPEDDENPIGVTDVDDLLELIPDKEDESEEDEIENMLNADDDSIDIDDILGIVEI